ncbi:MAG: hypothetical protein LBE25_14300 [Arthrobacter sp.]|nr:hypothetical protein [Arthrobacter sp.]
MKSLPFVSLPATRPRAARPLAAALAAGALALGLAACTPASQAPPVTDAPDTTSGVVRVSALQGDADALLEARAAVQVLNSAGVEAQLAPGDTLSPAGAREQLAAERVDLVFGGAEDWVDSAPTAAEASPSAGAGTGTAAPGTDGSAPSSDAATDATSEADAADVVPNDQRSATEAVSATLGDGLAVGTSALGDRRLSVVTTKAVAAAHSLDSASTLPAFCPEGRLAAAKEWLDSAGAAWESRSGCVPQQSTGTADVVAALTQLAGGKADLAIARSNDPRIVAWGLRALSDPGNTLGADPLLGVISTDRVGRDALDQLSKLASALGGENWEQLQRLDAESTVSDEDLRAWLEARSLVSEASPSGTASSSGS